MKQFSYLFAVAVLFSAFSSLGQTTSSLPDPGKAKRGEKLFNGEFPAAHGNGRTCATCHVPEEAFQLTPAHVEAHFQALQRRRLTDSTADDPLFRSVDANDGAQDFTNLRKHGLVRVFIQLPRNARGEKLVWPVDDPNATFVSVWRSTPTVVNSAFTGPYQLDGRQTTLEGQAIGALINHSEIENAPKTKFLEDVAAFQKTLFSSPSVRALSDALASGQTPPPTDPPLNALELRGKERFEHHCIFCHGGPTQTKRREDITPPQVQDIQISRPLPPFAVGIPFAPSPLQPRLWAFRVEGGEPLVRPSTDPGKALLSGDVNELNFFDMPTLFGIGKTAPYFHDNSAATLEDMLIHYQHHFEAVRRVIPDFLPWPLRPDPLTDEEIAPLVAYLKKI